MAEIEISFAKYAQLFFTILEGGKGNKTFFAKMLLNMGQSDNGKAIIEQEFPKETTPKGNIRIKPNKDSNLRKYLLDKEDGKSGKGISNIAPDLEAYFDKKQYVEDLEQYENSKLKEFAKALQLEVNFNNPKAVKQAIADCYYSIIKKACKTWDHNNEESNKPKALHRKIKRRHAEKIEEIIENIEALIEPLIYFSASFIEEDAFKLNYSRFFKLNGELCGYASMYPFIKSLQKISENIVEKTDFCICDASFSRIENYALFLLDIRKEIAALDEE